MSQEKIQKRRELKENFILHAKKTLKAGEALGKEIDLEDGYEKSLTKAIDQAKKFKHKDLKIQVTKKVAKKRKSRSRKSRSKKTTSKTAKKTEEKKETKK